MAVAGLAAALLLCGRPMYARIFPQDAARASREALHRVRTAQDLQRGLSRGRQGLVGSLSMAPLPTIIVSLCLAIPYVDTACLQGARGVGLYGSVLAALFGIVLGLYLNRLWAREGVCGPLRYAAVGLLLMLPPVARSIWAGETTMLFVLLVVAGWGFLTEWFKSFSLRDLAYAALLLGMSVGVRFQSVFIAALALVLIAVAVLAERRGLRLLEGTIVIFCVPTLYILALWAGGNWLILGNPLFLLRGVYGAMRSGTLDAPSVLTAGCEWGALAAAAVVVLAVPGMSLLRNARAGALVRNAVAALAVGLMIAASLYALAGTPRGPAFGPPAGPAIPQAVAHLEAEYPNGSFIVLGYEGYEFQEAARPDPQHAWVHLMHLERARLGKVFADFSGREVFVLLNTRPRLERWDDLGLDWRGARSRLAESFIYVETVGDWAVFECIRPNEPLLIGGAQT